MPVVINLPSALRKVFDEDAQAAFVDVLNQVQYDQRNGVERALEMHLNAFREYLDRRLVEARSETDKRFAESDIKMEKLFAETDSKMEKGFAGADAKTEKLITEADAKNEKRFLDVDVKFAQFGAKLDSGPAENQRVLLRWMFTFFAGTILALLGSLIAYLQVTLR
jgi:hypothetical protein